MPERSVITSLIGPAAPLLSINADSMSSLSDGSQFLPRAWHKSTPFLLDDQVIGPLNPVQFNVDVNFEIPKQATMLAELFLDAVYPPATIGGAGGQAAYVDWLGYAQVALFQTLFGSNKLYDVTSYDLYFRTREHMNLETLQREQILNLGDQTIAARNSALVNGIHLITDMMQPFACCPEAFHDTVEKAYPLVALSQKTRFTLRLDLLSNLITVPAGTTVAVNPPALEFRITSVNTTADEGSALLAMSQQTDGISYMIHQRIRQQSDTVQISNVTGANPVINLTSLTKPLKALYFALIPSHLQDNTNRNDKFFFEPQPPAPIPAGMTPYQPITAWSIESGGQIIQRRIDELYNRISQFGRRHPAPVGDRIYHQTYALNPVCLNEAHGFLDWTNLNNPRLTLHFPGTTGVDVDTGAAQTLVLIVNAVDYNWWYTKSGNITRAFN